MTTYTAIVGSEIDVDSPITESLMTRLRDNPIAITEGASGAPNIQTAALAALAVTEAKIAAGAVTASKIAVDAVGTTKIINDAVTAAKIVAGAVGESEIASAAVHRAELATATASSTTAVSATSSATVALTGSTYAWWTASAVNDSIIFGGGDVAAGSIGVYNTDSVARGFYVDERYISASPPYDLGDGNIPVFIYAKIENGTGKLLGLSVADDPIWAYHGPTNIEAMRIDKKTRRKYRTEKVVKSTGDLLSVALKNPVFLRDFLQRDIEVIEQEIEITKQFKNSDMNTHPHPWIYDQPGNYQVGLLSLLGPMAERLAEIGRQNGKAFVRQLIENEMLIDNQALNLRAPAGMAVYGLKFKNSGG